MSLLSILRLSVFAILLSTGAYAASWSARGADLRNSSQAQGKQLLSADAIRERGLRIKWKADTRIRNEDGELEGGNMRGPPAIYDAKLYAIAGSGTMLEPLTPAASLQIYDVASGKRELTLKLLDLHEQAEELLGYPVFFDNSIGTPVLAGDLVIFGASNTVRHTGDLAPLFLGLERLVDWGIIPGPNRQLGGAEEVLGAFLVAVHRETGKLAWVTKLDPNPVDGVLSSPVLFEDRVYVGTAAMEYANNGISALVLAITLQELLGTSELLRPLRQSIMGLFLDVEDPAQVYECCTAKGSVLALDAASGKILWKTYTAPQLDDYYSASVWGSSFSIDEERRLLYVGTGNNSEVPRAADLCELERRGSLSSAEKAELAQLLQERSEALPGTPQVVCGASNITAADPQAVRQREIWDPLAQEFIADTIYLNDAHVPHTNEAGYKSFGNYPNAILALHLDDEEEKGVEAGDLAWALRAREYDSFLADCDYSARLGLAVMDEYREIFAFPDIRRCVPAGPDADFAQAPMLIEHAVHGDMLVAGTKAGNLWALSAEQEGAVLWRKKVSIAAVLSGMAWGSSHDGVNVYTTQAQSRNYTSSEGHMLPLIQDEGRHAHRLCDGYSLDDDLNGNPRGKPEPSCQVAPGSITKTLGSYVSAHRLIDGATLWQFADPSGDPEGDPENVDTNNGGTSIAGDVLFVGSLSPEPELRALDAKTGEVLWSHSAPDLAKTSIKPAIVDGVVYWGTGGSFSMGTALGKSGGDLLLAVELCPEGSRVSEDGLSCLGAANAPLPASAPLTQHRGP